MVEDFIVQLNNAMQIRLLNKFTVSRAYLLIN